MSKRNRTPKLTLQEAEQRISAFLRPWLFRRFMQIKQIGFLVAKGEYIKDDSNFLTDSEKIYQFNEWKNESMQLKKELVNESRNQEHTIGQIAKVLKQTKALHIQKAKLMASTFLKEYRRAISETKGCCEHDWMNDDELMELSHLTVFTHLECSLSDDRASFLSLEQFTKCGYDGIKSREDYTKIYESRKAALFRAYEKYENMYRMLQEYKKVQFRVTQPVRYKRENERKLSLLDIVWCDAWSQGDLELVKLFFFRKDWSKRKSEHNTKQNELLRNALNRYAQLINQTVACYPEGERQIAKCKEYVAKCCLIQKLERSYHFSLAGHIADYAIEHGYKPDAYDKAHLSSYTGVYKDEEWLLILSKQLLDKNGERKYRNMFPSLRTLGFDTITEQIFETTEAEQIDHLTQKELMQRTATYNLLLMLEACLPYDNLLWRDADFYEAAEFLKTEYQFLDRLTTWELPEVKARNGQLTEQQKKTETRTQKFLDYYYVFYLELYKDESTLTKQIVADMTKLPAKKGKRQVKS